MDIPKKIKINAHNIGVETCDSKDVNSAGQYDEYHRIIKVRSDDDVPESKQAEAFMHEIFEAVNAIDQLDMNHFVLTILSESLFQVIRDNKLRFDLAEEEDFKIELQCSFCYTAMKNYMLRCTECEVLSTPVFVRVKE
ncbi:MAG: hypothetical protein KAR20_28305 [Candidatus Heimdallarchaeota archaeon]|nr:hypothetical protein [Candidatus Heimdallarchaeota archaeon]